MKQRAIPRNPYLTLAIGPRNRRPMCVPDYFAAPRTPAGVLPFRAPCARQSGWGQGGVVATCMARAQGGARGWRHSHVLDG